MLLVKQRLARLVPGWVTQGSCSGAVIGWVQVYYMGEGGVREKGAPFVILFEQTIHILMIMMCNFKDFATHHFVDIEAVPPLLPVSHRHDRHSDDEGSGRGEGS